MKGSQSYFWGIFLIGTGVLMILKYQLKLNIALPRIIVGVLFLALGVSMLVGGFGVKTKSNMFFSEGTLEVNKPERDYNVVFGNMVIDLTNIPEDELNKAIEINAIFGNTTIKLDPEIPTIIKLNSAFGSAATPDGTNITFGDHVFVTGEGDPVLRIESNTVFGKTEFVYD